MRVEQKKGEACLNHRNPFGLTMRQSKTATPANRYLYNGKELQQETQWYDYGARMYDGALGRFFTQDRFAEKYLDFSPYQYAAGNPVKYIDVNGGSLDVSHMDEANQILLINSLEELTGLTIQVSNGHLIYETNEKGKAVISKNEKGKKNGSRFARKNLLKAIKNENTVTLTDKVHQKGSHSPGGFDIINLDPYQIEGLRQSSSIGMDSEAMGWGMIFFHEYFHTPMGGEYKDNVSSEDLLGETARRVNKIRRQLSFSTRLLYSPSLNGSESDGRQIFELKFSKGNSALSVGNKSRKDAMSTSQYGMYLKNSGIIK